MRIALTGGIGSGKSTVAALMAGHGALVVDADRIAREIVTPGQPALVEITGRFGEDVLRPDGSLDRAALASVVFTDPDALADLNAITHPRIAARSAELLAAADPDAVVVYDMPLLVEQRSAEGWDAVVVVEAPLAQRIERLVRARGMTDTDARARIDAQASDEERRAVADHVIVNSGSPAELSVAVDEMWRELTG